MVERTTKTRGPPLAAPHWMCGAGMDTLTKAEPIRLKMADLQTGRSLCQLKFTTLDP